MVTCPYCGAANEGSPAACAECGHDGAPFGSSGSSTSTEATTSTGASSTSISGHGIEPPRGGPSGGRALRPGEHAGAATDPSQQQALAALAALVQGVAGVQPPWTPPLAAAPRTPTAPIGGPPPQVDSDVLRALREVSKFAAIKMQSLRTGMGLKDAKDLIDQLERALPGMAMRAPAASAAPTTSTTPRTSPAATQPSTSDELPGVPPDVLASLRDGCKVHAIKLYRDRTGASLQEAKAFVEGVQRRLEAMKKP